MLVALCAIVLATGLGSGLVLARLCLVNAIDDWTARRDAGGLRFQAGLIAAGSALFLFELVFDRGGVAAPIPAMRIEHALLGGILLAAGAVVNEGCYLGTISQIGRGRSRFLFTFLGLYLAEIVSFPTQLMLSSKEMILPTMVAPTASLLAAGGAILAWLYLPQTQDAVQFDRLAGVAIAAVCAAGLFFLLPGVSYGAVTAALAHPNAAMPGLGPVAGAAIIAGAIAGCALSGRWQPEAPDFLGSGRSLVGGYVMATGAQCVPGGSDNWLLWTIPRGGLHGLVAYLSAGAAVLLWCQTLRHIQRK